LILNLGLEGLLFTSDGDMRAALNNLQAIIAGFKVLDYDYVFKICDQPKPEEINKILDACKKSQFMKVSSF
jgi:replication factor C subunit 2/4